MKILRITVIMTFISLAAIQMGQAQELGIRFGDAMANKSSVAIDGVFALGKFSRIHGDVSFGNGVGVELLWDFLYRPIEKSPINWYVGVGPSLYLGSPFALGASGEIGVEYRFQEAPIAIGLDYRPTFVLVETTAFVNSFGFNIRYVFK
jgi:hypothetical protein